MNTVSSYLKGTYPAIHLICPRLMVHPRPLGRSGKSSVLIARRQVYELERVEVANWAIGTALVVPASVEVVEQSSFSDRVERHDL